MKRIVSVIIACTLMFTFSGCGDSQKSSQMAISNQSPSVDTTPKNNPAPAAKQNDANEKTAPNDKVENHLTVKVYFPDKQATTLVEKTADIQWNSDETKYDAALQALFKTGDQNVSVVWKEQSVKLKLDHGLLSVDLAKPVQAGSTVERYMILSLLKTMFQFPEVQMVQILIGGKKVETLSGHIGIEQPFNRKSLADL